MKKLVKRILTAVLTGAMIFSVGAFPALAAGSDGKITITNPSVDVTYNAYKIFDMDYSDGNYAYTIDSSSGFFAAVQTYAAGENSGLTITQIGTSSTYNVTVDESKFSTAAFGASMKAAVTDAMTADATETDSETTSNLSLNPATLSYGYYLVTGTKGGELETLVSLDSTNTEAHIVEKNDTPGWHSDEPGGGTGKTVKIEEDGTTKYVETTDMNIGDTVTFAIQIDAKNYVGKNLVKNYIIRDSMPAGFTFGSITSVKAGTTDLTANYTNSDFPTGAITIPWATGSDDVGWTSLYNPSTVITIEYTATLNENAVIDGAGNANKATFTYQYGKTPENPNPDPDPGDPTDPSQWTDADQATVYTYAIALKKINKSGTALAGATFSLPDGMKVSAVTGKTNTYVVDKDGSTTSITTAGDDASFTIIGVAAGTYAFTETAAPSGYNKLTSPVSVEAQQISATSTSTNTTFYLDAAGDVVDSKTDVAVTYTNNDYAVTPVAVVNLTGAELPSTGGAGTTMFYVIGTICVAGAAILLITKKRMSSRS